MPRISISSLSVLKDSASSAAKMWIQVRTMDGAKSSRIDGLSKLTKIEELRLRVRDDFEVDTPLQRLFYRGKQVKAFSTAL